MAKIQEKILIIKLSALGDFIQNLGIMRSIRHHHRNAHITLLTTAPYKDFAEKSGYFDEIWVDPRPKFYQIKTWIGLKNKLNHAHFSRVYDLQINDRTALYYSLLNPKPEWIGAVKKDKRNKTGFAFYRHKEMVEKVGIKNVNIDRMEWINSDISRFDLKKPYALIIPGCAPTRPEKRWPAAHFIDLCHYLINQNIQPVIIGTNDEKDVTDHIAQNCPEALNLAGKTSLFDIAPLARNALISIGNDTGPLHIIGPTGCPSIVLFSGKSDPSCHAPLGDKIITLQKDNIADILPQDVIDKINL
ncbi:MAG: glycosyltransferase family 9 protein [Alphaproteobacteria bacterium]|nr:glycosyltransferase family 9 protein [Alphaproteobacteria bacterium]